MIRRPRLRSLLDGSIWEEWTIIVFRWMKYRTPALMTLPDFANSMFLLLDPLPFLAERCTVWALAKLTCRGRENSESDAEIPVSWVISQSSTAANTSSETSDTRLSVQFQKAAATMTGSRYFRNRFISESKYTTLMQLSTRSKWIQKRFFNFYLVNH